MRSNSARTERTAGRPQHNQLRGGGVIEIA